MPPKSPDPDELASDGLGKAKGAEERERRRRPGETSAEDEIVPETQYSTVEEESKSETEMTDPEKNPPQPLPEEGGISSGRPYGESPLEATGHQGDSEEETQMMSPDRLASVLEHALKEAQTTKPRLQVWLDLVQELFLKVCPQTTSKKSALSPAAQRLPRLRKGELERLLDVFEDIVVVQQQEWRHWQNIVVEACHLVYKSRQSLEYILSKHLGKRAIKEAMSRAPVLTQWATKVTGQTDPATPTAAPAYEPFRFKLDTYSAEEITRLKAVCEHTYGRHAMTAYRKCTEDEWTIVQGIVEGTILCRQLPQFFNRIMAPESKVKIVNTIRAQVEGCLVMNMEGELPIRDAFWNTRSLQESISTAISTRGLGIQANQQTQAVWQMLAAVKAISYVPMTHELRFHFFTRAEASRFENLEIPFHRTTHVARNVHAVRAGNEENSAWERQYDEDGTLVSQASEYLIILRNVTRSLDLTRFHAFLQQMIGTPFGFDDLDVGGPNSSTSTARALRFTMDGCPKALTGVVRIIWFDTTIVVQHPAMRGRQQCLRCGRTGHYMRTCSMSPAALRGPGSLVATDNLLAQLPELQSTFTSLEELRQSVEENQAQPLQRQQQQGHQPASNGGLPLGKQSGTCQTDQQSQQVSHELATSRKEETGDWFDGGRTRNPTRQRVRQGQALRENERAAITAQLDSVLISGETTKSSQPKLGLKGSKDNPLSLASSLEQETKDGHSNEKPTPRQTAKSKQAENAKFLVAEDAAKRELFAVLAEVTPQQGPLQRTVGRYDIDPIAPMTMQQASEFLGVQHVETPPTGNCQAYSVIQALANSEFTRFTGQLERATAAIKRGGVARAQIDFASKYQHAARKNALEQLGRGYEKMGRQASELPFRQYLEEFGTSPSAVEDFLPANLWGSNDTLAAFSTMLQREIFVLSHDNRTSEWGAIHYEPETQQVTRNNRVFTFSTSGERVLSAVGCIEKIAQLKREAGADTAKLPLVLSFQDKHYTAYVHGQRALTQPSTARSGEVTGDGDEDMDSNESDFEDEKLIRDATLPYQQTSGVSLQDEDAGMHSISDKRNTTEQDRGMKTEGEYSPSYQGDYESQSPWNPDTGQGDIEEIRRRMTGPTIHHSLKQEVDLILRHGGERTAELNHFLNATVSQMSLPDQEQLLAMDLQDPDQSHALMTKYQIAEPVLRQWTECLEAERQENRGISQIEQGGSSQEPGSVLSPQRTRQRSPRSVKTPSVRPKRAHAPTPEERMEVAGQVVNVNNQAVPIKKRSNDQMVKNLQAAFNEVAERKPDPKETTGGMLPSWPLLWNSQEATWTQHTKVTFPKVGATAEEWVQASNAVPGLVTHLLRTFSHPHEIIVRIPATAICALTSNWREQCWMAAVEHAVNDDATYPQRRARLKAWKKRVDLIPVSDKQHQLRQALINSTEEWVLEQHEKYGGSSTMRLCAPKRKLRLGHYLLCAHVYAEKIAVLIGSIPHESDPITLLLERHMHALRTRQEYQRRCLAGDRQQAVHWDELGGHMASILSDGSGCVQESELDAAHHSQY